MGYDFMSSIDGMGIIVVHLTCKGHDILDLRDKVEHGPDPLL